MHMDLIRLRVLRLSTALTAFWATRAPSSIGKAVCWARVCAQRVAPNRRLPGGPGGWLGEVPAWANLMGYFTMFPPLFALWHCWPGALFFMWRSA